MGLKKLLLVSATLKEAEFLLDFKHDKISADSYRIYYKSLVIDLLIGGVGIPFFIYNLSKHLSSNSYKTAILIGISGSYNTELYLSECVVVNKDSFADLGAEEENGFVDIFEMGFADANTYPFKNSVIESNMDILSGYKRVSGNTVYSISYNKKRLLTRDADTESMEGAAFLYCCKKENIDCLQLRSISNYVGERDKEKWKINEALHNLSVNTEFLLEELL